MSADALKITPKSDKETNESPSVKKLKFESYEIEKNKLLGLNNFVQTISAIYFFQWHGSQTSIFWHLGIHRFLCHFLMKFLKRKLTSQYHF